MLTCKKLVNGWTTLPGCWRWRSRVRVAYLTSPHNHHSTDLQLNNQFALSRSPKVSPSKAHRPCSLGIQKEGGWRINALAIWAAPGVGAVNIRWWSVLHSQADVQAKHKL